MLEKATMILSETVKVLRILFCLQGRPLQFRGCGWKTGVPQVRDRGLSHPRIRGSHSAVFSHVPVV